MLRTVSITRMIVFQVCLLSATAVTFGASDGLGWFENRQQQADEKQHLYAIRARIDLEPTTSGARSIYPMSALALFGDAFNLFNFFNVFRGSKLVDHTSGELLPPLDDTKPITTDSPAVVPTTTAGSDNQLGGLTAKFDQLKASIAFGKTRQQQQQQTRTNSASNPSSPVILVPGYGGSQLEAKLDKPSVVRYFCDYKSDWSDVWINVKLLLPYMIDCLIDNLRLEFDYATNTTRNTPGVDIRVKNGTQISSVEYLCDLPMYGFGYFAPIIDKLVARLGYARELSIRGAPYDFRKAPNELGEYFHQLRVTSEQMFTANEGKPVTYICHSMGCNNMLYFLQRQSQEWKSTYVKRLISVAAPWGGSLSALRAAALGDDLGLPYLFSESKLIHVQRSLPSTIYLFPHREAFADIPLIRSNVGKGLTADNKQASGVSTTTNSLVKGEKLYFAHDYKSFFDHINHPDGYRMWLNTKDLLGSLEAPNVELWCLVGRGEKTLGSMEYSGEFPHSSSSEIYDDGDGTVNLLSAMYCKRWQNKQEQPIYYTEFSAGHMELLKEAKVVEHIESILAYK